MLFVSSQRRSSLKMQERSDDIELDELLDLTKELGDRYEINHVIGRGTFSIVYKGFDRKMERDVALKRLHYRDIKAGWIPPHVYREATTLRSLMNVDGSNIIR